MILHQVTYAVGGCGICHEDTIYSLQFHEDGRITHHVEGCSVAMKNRARDHGKEATFEEAMELINEQRRWKRDYLAEIVDELAELDEQIESVEMWSKRLPEVARKEFEEMVAPLLEKYQR
jgi:hypothetical protein